METKNSVKNAENFQQCAFLERVTGIGPVSATWQAAVLPLNYTRINQYFNIKIRSSRHKETTCVENNFGVKLHTLTYFLLSKGRLDLAQTQ